MIPYLPEDISPQFPHPSQALDDPDGLLAAGGLLTAEWLLLAYTHGIFPWFNDDDDYILWWSPKTRPIFRPDAIRINRSLRKSLKRYNTITAPTDGTPYYSFSIDRAFSDVIHACAAPRKNESGTWITEEMVAAYLTLHEMGVARSVEMWQHANHDAESELVGGFYGIQLGAAFFGESMFSRVPDASKCCFVRFCYAFHHAGGKLIDSQMETPHMQRLGAQTCSREAFITQLPTLTQQNIRIDATHLSTDANTVIQAIALKR